MSRFKLAEPLLVLTPAKINLHLYVQHRRPDGYHELALDFVPISLYDQIEFFDFGSPGLWFLSEPELCPPEQNLVVKAIKALEREIGEPLDLGVKLTKQVPNGAGLGGGSANAAGTLVALNRALGLGISGPRLWEIATALGADVPFFLDPKPQQASGIGEILHPLEGALEWPLLLVKPPVSISTAQAYQHCQHSARKLPRSPYDRLVLEAINPRHNDFFAPLSLLYPELLALEQALTQAGAAAVQMSGSGSVMYGLFLEVQVRDLAKEKLAPLGLGTLYTAEIFLSHQYGP